LRFLKEKLDVPDHFDAPLPEVFSRTGQTD
jgi:hypothetical protein